MKLSVLHVGCGPKPLPEIFSGWQEIRLDINPDVYPDVCCSMTDITLPPSVVDVVWAAHCLEHLEKDETEAAAREFFRVLKPGGKAFVGVPDLGLVARLILEGKLEETHYISPAGPITPLDMIYGCISHVKSGNSFMMHRMGFTEDTLSKLFRKVGFSSVERKRPIDDIDLWIKAEK